MREQCVIWLMRDSLGREVWMGGGIRTSLHMWMEPVVVDMNEDGKHGLYFEMVGRRVVSLEARDTIPLANYKYCQISLFHTTIKNVKNAHMS